MEENFKHICCFCLTDSNNLMFDLFSKSENCDLSHFEKVSTVFSQLADVSIIYKNHCPDQEPPKLILNLMLFNLVSHTRSC